MTHQKNKNTDAEKVIDLIDQLNEKVKLDQSLTYISDEQYQKIMDRVGTLSINIYNHKLVSNQSKDRLDELTHVITSIAALDFSQKATVGTEENHLDYIAIGLNLLSHQLKKQFTPLQIIKKVYDITDNAVIVTNDKFEIKYINTSGERILGRKAQELLDKNIANYIKDFDPNSFSKSIVRNKLEFIAKSGDLYKSNVNVYQLNKLEKDPIVSYAFEVQRNYGLQNDMEGIVKRADLLSININRIHHDIMSPVRSIQGASELMRIQAKSNDTIQLLSSIQSCCKAIELHVKDLFNMLFLKSDETTIELIHFAELIESVWNELSYLPNYSEINRSVYFKISNAFYSDKKLILSVFHNLISNAIKYKKEKDPSIYISVKDHDNGILIEVKDNGLGINEQDLENIFLPNFRTTTVGDGKGLGLYITKQLIERLGGYVKVESCFGVGSIFTVFMPSLK